MSRRAIVGARNKEVYTPGQIKAIIRACGIDIAAETYTAFVCFCPFHQNTHDPSFAVNSESGLYICFNPGCDARGSLTMLVKSLTGKNEFEALRFISKKASESAESLEDIIKRRLEADTFTEWQPGTIERLHAALPGSPAERYMLEERGFQPDTLDYFMVGYSPQEQNERFDMVTVPVHSPDGLVVGMVGRSIEGKQFKNSKGLPRNKTLFNIHRAKKVGEIAIIVESSFDAMLLYQAGFPNVVAVLGGNMSPNNYNLLDKYFNKIIIATDFDELDFPKNGARCSKCGTKASGCIGHNAGRTLGNAIAGTLRNKDIWWAAYAPGVIYPRGRKDIGSLTQEERIIVIKNAVTNFEYQQWNVEEEQRKQLT